MKPTFTRRFDQENISSKPLQLQPIDAHSYIKNLASRLFSQESPYSNPMQPHLTSQFWPVLSPRKLSHFSPLHAHYYNLPSLLAQFLHSFPNLEALILECFSPHTRRLTVLNPEPLFPQPVFLSLKTINACLILTSLFSLETLILHCFKPPHTQRLTVLDPLPL